MIEFEQKLHDLQEVKPKIDELKVSLQIETSLKKITELEEISTKTDFYEREDSSKILQEISALKAKISDYNVLFDDYAETVDLIKMAIDEGEQSLFTEIAQAADLIITKTENLGISALLKGDYDSKNAIISFNAGAGGTESCDWVQMLLRMYTRWAERRGFKTTILDMLDGDEAGIKSATVQINGTNAYGYLRSEMGVHRLVRISPFDSSGRRHTSFAAVEVMPEIDDDAEIEIKDEDLRVDTFRAGGAGGQHVNKTESAVRITHIPTGVVVSCQNQRSQHQNRDVCMRLLKSKLIEIKERENLAKIEDIKGVQREIAWGSQIRSYVFMPYTLVKDHRTNYENGNVAAVMDGDLDGFMNAYLKMRVEENNG